ncbi:MAG TPA: phosphoglycerate kinase [Candidatus Saccharimonadales bacterium]|nr:phosphoglycerate kinase [Candidatus Saccharimonadales bacterium]
MRLKSVEDLDVRGRVVLLRAALNVPIEKRKVKDTQRLRAALPTIQYLIKHQAKVVLISHLSKEGESLAPVAPVLSRLLKRAVAFVPDSTGPAVEQTIADMEPGHVIMLENLRLKKGEEANDAKFAKSLAALGDAYVDDDFTVMHRSHASVVGLPKLLPAAAGFLVQKEVEAITSALDNPKRPLFAIVGGAKISTKIPLIENLLKKVDGMLIGGAMANTFIAADGGEVGKSLYEKDQMQLTRDISAEATKRKVSLILPVDVVVASSLGPRAKATVKNLDEVSTGDIIADIGPATTAKATQAIKSAGTIIWNGPVGVAEFNQFAKSSKKLARAIAATSATSIIGGGDTAAFLDKIHMADDFSFVSTGGGAGLELMAGNKLPGLEPLIKK